MRPIKIPDTFDGSCMIENIRLKENDSKKAWAKAIRVFNNESSNWFALLHLDKRGVVRCHYKRKFENRVDPTYIHRFCTGAVAALLTNTEKL